MNKTSRIEVWLTLEEIEQLRVIAAKEGFRSSGKYLQALTRVMLKESGVPENRSSGVIAQSGVPELNKKIEDRSSGNRMSKLAIMERYKDQPAEIGPELRSDIELNQVLEYCPVCNTRIVYDDITSEPFCPGCRIA